MVVIVVVVMMIVVVKAVVVLPVVADTFNSFFSLVSTRHNYNTRLASNKTNYSRPSARTNYGKFNIRFSAIKLWNSLNENLRHSTKAKFK